jgi:hypothetical protein
MGFFGKVSKWVGKLGKGIRRGFKSIGGIGGVRKTIGRVAEHAKTIGSVASKAAPIVKALLGNRAGGLVEGVGRAAGAVGKYSGQAHRASHLAEDAVGDVRSGYRAVRSGNVGAAVKAGNRLKGKYKGGSRYVRG